MSVQSNVKVMLVHCQGQPGLLSESCWFRVRLVLIQYQGYVGTTSLSCKSIVMETLVLISSSGWSHFGSVLANCCGHSGRMSMHFWFNIVALLVGRSGQVGLRLAVMTASSTYLCPVPTAAAAEIMATSAEMAAVAAAKAMAAVAAAAAAAVTGHIVNKTNGSAYDDVCY